MVFSQAVKTRRILLKIWIYLIVLGHMIALIPSSHPQGPTLMKDPEGVTVENFQQNN